MRPSLISHPTPLSSPLLIYSLRSAPHRFRPFPSIVFPVVSRLSPRLSVPRLRFPFSPLDFPSLSPRRIRIFLPPRSFPHQAAPSVALFPSFSRLSVSFIPFRYAPLIVRACHASPRWNHPTISWLAPGFARAAFFLSISPSLSLARFHRRSGCYRWPVGGHTIGGSWRDDGKRRTTSEVTDVIVNGGGANEGVTGVASN